MFGCPISTLFEQNSTLQLKLTLAVNLWERYRTRTTYEHFNSCSEFLVFSKNRFQTFLQTFEELQIWTFG